MRNVAMGKLGKWGIAGRSGEIVGHSGKIAGQRVENLRKKAHRSNGSS